MESLFEQLGGTYTRQGDYCLPDVCLPPEEERPIGVYGQRRRVYLKKHHRVLYFNLLTAGVPVVERFSQLEALLLPQNNAKK